MASSPPTPPTGSGVYVSVILFDPAVGIGARGEHCLDTIAAGERGVAEVRWEGFVTAYFTSARPGAHGLRLAVYDRNGLSICNSDVVMIEIAHVPHFFTRAVPLTCSLPVGRYLVSVEIENSSCNAAPLVVAPSPTATTE